MSIVCILSVQSQAYMPLKTIKLRECRETNNSEAIYLNQRTIQSWTPQQTVYFFSVFCVLLCQINLLCDWQFIQSRLPRHLRHLSETHILCCCFILHLKRVPISIIVTTTYQLSGFCHSETHEAVPTQNLHAQPQRNTVFDSKLNVIENKSIYSRA